MPGAVAVHGLEPRQGEPAFAFLVLRLARPMERAELVEVLRHVAPMIPDAEGFLAGFPDEVDEAMRIVGLPWVPPEPRELEAHRALIERAAALGVEAAWFFQIGTSLPPAGDDEDAEAAGEGEGGSAEAEATNGAEAEHAAEASLIRIAATTDDAWDDPFAGDLTDPETQRLHLEDVHRAAAEDEGGEDDDDDDDLDDDEDDDDLDDDDDDAAWSHGPPPQRAEVPFPVDGYPAILEELDWEDFGISFKLAGPFTPGESTVLLGFHALWLSPYGEARYRNASVTIDRRHHAAHLWVDRFAVPCSAEEQVGYLLWVLAKLHEVTPILHARFGGATMPQKYGGLMGDPGEPFVLGGNPLLAIYAIRGEAGVDEWIAAQTDWSNDELAQMLRELAEEIVVGSSDPHEEEEDEEDEDGDDDEDRDEEDDGSGGGGEDEDEDEGDDEEDRGRYITAHAGELLRARARAGLLDPRVADALRPLLEVPAPHEHRRAAVVEILGALRDGESVPAMIRILEEPPVRDRPGSIGQEDFLAATAAALGAIGDPAAIPALAKLVAARGPLHDRPRPAAADALAACLARAPEPRDVDDAVVGAMLETIRERDDGELNAEMHVAYGRIARQLAPVRRDDVRRRLEETAPARDDDTARLARHAALALAGDGGPLDAGAAAALRPLVHAALTAPGDGDGRSVRDLRIALRVAELLPELVAPADLVGLTRLAEPDLRERAHALLERLDHQFDAEADPEPAEPDEDDELDDNDDDEAMN